MSDYGFWADTGEEVSREEIEERFDDMLDETSEPAMIGDMSWPPSEVLRELDPVAYRCGVNDYHDALMRDGEIVEELEEV